MHVGPGVVYPIVVYAADDFGYYGCCIWLVHFSRHGGEYTLYLLGIRSHCRDLDCSGGVSECMDGVVGNFDST